MRQTGERHGRIGSLLRRVTRTRQMLRRALRSAVAVGSRMHVLVRDEILPHSTATPGSTKCAAPRSLRGSAALHRISHHLSAPAVSAREATRAAALYGDAAAGREAHALP